MTKEDALHRVKGYLTDYLPIDCVGEIDEIIEALSVESTGQNVLEELKQEFCNRYPKNAWGDYELGGLASHFSLREVLEILDKYAGNESKMRDATPQEKASVDRYIENISTETGVKFYDSKVSCNTCGNHGKEICHDCKVETYHGEKVSIPTHYQIPAKESEEKQ